MTSRRTSPTSRACTCPSITTARSCSASPTTPRTGSSSADAASAARVVYDHFGGADAFPRASARSSWRRSTRPTAPTSRSTRSSTRRAGSCSQLPHGPAHRAGALPRLPDLELPAHDVAGRRVHHDDRRRDPRDARRRRARRAVPRAPRGGGGARSAAARRVHGNVVVLDLRNEEVIHPTNRFMLYALFPQCNISIHVLWGLRRQNTVFATGRSILDRSSRDERRRADAPLRRRRPRRGRHLPGGQRATPSASWASSSQRSTPTGRGGGAQQCPHGLPAPRHLAVGRAAEQDALAGQRGGHRRAGAGRRAAGEAQPRGEGG